MKRHGLRRIGGDPLHVMGWWVFARAVSDEAIRAQLRATGYSPGGFWREAVGAYGGTCRVEPMTLTRRGSRTLVKQVSRTTYR